jgi:integrase
MPPKKDDKVFHLPAHANVDAALKRIAKKVGIQKTISFHTSRHTFGTLIQAATGDIETTKKLMGHKSLKSTAVYADVLTEEKSRLSPIPRRYSGVASHTPRTRRFHEPSERQRPIRTLARS